MTYAFFNWKINTNNNVLEDPHPVFTYNISFIPYILNNFNNQLEALELDMSFESFKWTTEAWFNLFEDELYALLLLIIA